MMYFVYVLYSSKLDRFYIGTTDNVIKRVEEHNSNHYQDSFTSRGIPWELFFSIEGLTPEQGYKIEKHIKSMKSSVYIKNLKQYPEMVNKLKTKYK